MLEKGARRLGKGAVPRFFASRCRLAGPSAEPSTTGGTGASDELRSACAGRSDGTIALCWAQAFFSQPKGAAAAIMAAAALGTLLVVPMAAWGAAELAGLAAIAAVIAAGACAHIAAPCPLPAWVWHADVAGGNVLMTVVVAMSAAKHIDVGALYVLLALFAMAYLPLRWAAGHLGLAAAAYAVVLSLSPPVAEPRAMAWLAVSATAAVAGVVVASLVGALRAAARGDPLTGLANRRSWDERLEQELERAARSLEPLSVLVADLDGFKAVNDTAGHQAGDAVLRAVAGAWLREVRDGGDFLARLGGDEFGVIAPGADALGARKLAQRLASALPEGVSASIGVATWERTEGASELVRRADWAMYQAKRRHRRGAALARQA
ncbi:MAG: GGDEF domain-containing protein [Acidimicrobiales bacterium]